MSITTDARSPSSLSLRRCLQTDPSKHALYVNELRTDTGSHSWSSAALR